MNGQAITKEDVKGFSRSLLEDLVIRLLEQNEELTRSVQLLTEQVNVLTSQKFGRQTEKSSELESQMEFCFNEAEVTVADASEEELEEPEIEDINPANAPSSRKKGKGTRQDIIKELPERHEVYQLSDDQLICHCGGNYEKIGEETVQRLEFHPATFEVVTQHIYTYKCSKCSELVRADHPLPLFEASLATPSLLAGIMTAKYVNAMPFYRLEKSFADHSAFLSRQTMARWMINAADRYFYLVYERFRQELLACNIIHADETTVTVSKDGRKAGAKSFMWVYTKESDVRPVVIFEYQKTRAAMHPKEFLKDYQGYLCCDGYSGYHNLNPDITVCGCWSHARRHFCNAEKSLKDVPERKTEFSISAEALRWIGSMFHKVKQWKDLPYDERQEKRNTELKNDLDDYFKWIGNQVRHAPPKSETGKGLAYSLNQKEYLMNFLKNADVPMDNSEAERKIRNFVISRKNFVLIDTLNGAEASAILFSMSETAKANNLKPFDYFKYLLEELPKHQKDNSKDLSFLDDLMPWSDKLPEEIRKTQK